MAVSRKKIASKEEKFIHACMQILRLEVLRGHLKWTVVELSKVSSCSRVWLYTNFGEGKSRMLENAVRIYVDDFYGFSPQRQKFSQEFGYMASLWKSRQGLEKHPEILIFYFDHRNRRTFIGDLIRKAEKKYMDVLIEKFAIEGRDELLLVRTFLHGLATAFFLTREETNASFAKFMNTFKSRP